MKIIFFIIFFVKNFITKQFRIRNWKSEKNIFNEPISLSAEIRLKIYHLFPNLILHLYRISLKLFEHLEFKKIKRCCFFYSVFFLSNLIPKINRNPYNKVQRNTINIQRDIDIYSKYLLTTHVLTLKKKSLFQISFTTLWDNFLKNANWLTSKLKNISRLKRTNFHLFSK